MPGNGNARYASGELHILHQCTLNRFCCRPWPSRLPKSFGNDVTRGAALEAFETQVDAVAPSDVFGRVLPFEPCNLVSEIMARGFRISGCAVPGKAGQCRRCGNPSPADGLACSRESPHFFISSYVRLQVMAAGSIQLRTARVPGQLWPNVPSWLAAAGSPLRTCSRLWPTIGVFQNRAIGHPARQGALLGCVSPALRRCDSECPLGIRHQWGIVGAI